MNHQEIAEISAIVAGWTKTEAQKGKMLAKNPSDIETEIASGRSVIVTDECGAPISYCGIETWARESWIEVGSLVVEENHRGKGIGTKISKETINLAGQRFPNSEIFALTKNNQSKELIEKIGGIKIAKNDLPNEVWDLCHETGKECEQWEIYPNCSCTPFLLTHLRESNKGGSNDVVNNK